VKVVGLSRTSIRYDVLMATVLDREEYIEQAYFFRTFRDRQSSNQATQEILEGVHEEILSTTRLPLAIQFLATEMKHTGLLSSGFARLGHYFTPFQTYVIRRTEEEAARFTTDTALQVLEREAEYRAAQPTPQGLFIYQFEVLSRNKLGYDEGLAAIAADPFYSAEWRDYAQLVRRQGGTVEFADLVYLRSEFYVLEQRRRQPGYQPPAPPMFGEREGKIARANRGRDPLYLFAALQRQLGYPRVPRPTPPDDLGARFLALKARVRDLEQRLQLVESELRGQVDLKKFGEPDMFKPASDED
jgi:hypothetical protein